MSRFKTAILGATMLATAGGIAYAQQPQPTYDPAQLPATQGKVAQYTLTPRGDVDGLILDDGTEVHLPPYLSTQLVYAIKPGDAVTIHGLKARALPMVMAMSVTNDATHATIVASGPRGPGGGERTTLDAQGPVKEQLHGPRGDLNGVVLQDGTIVRLPPPEAQKIADQLAVGKTLYVSGNGLESPLGRVIDARSIGPSKDQVTQIQGPRPGGMWRAFHWRDEARRGPMGPDGAPPPPPPPRP